MLIILLLSLLLVYTAATYNVPTEQPQVRLIQQALELNKEAISSWMEAEKILEQAKMLNAESLARFEDVENILDSQKNLARCLLKLQLHTIM